MKTVLHHSFGSIPRVLITALSLLAFAPVAYSETEESTVRGINGSSVRGINGSSVRGINGSSVRGINGSSVRSQVFASVAVGPLEAIEIHGQTSRFTVAGQTYTTDADVIFSVGDYVVAAGELDGVAEVLYSAGTQYVPGASKVLVVGSVKGVETSLATAAIGNVAVDYSNQLAFDPTYSPEPGNVIRVEGIQPVPGGKIVVLGPQDDSPITAGSVEGLALRVVSGG